MRFTRLSGSPSGRWCSLDLYVWLPQKQLVENQEATWSEGRQDQSQGGQAFQWFLNSTHTACARPCFQSNLAEGCWPSLLLSLPLEQAFVSLICITNPCEFWASTVSPDKHPPSLPGCCVGMIPVFASAFIC